MMKRVDLSVAPFALQVSSSRTEGGGGEEDVEAKAGEKSSSQSPSPASDSTRNGVRYRECMKNHAASIGGHANDGCGEFMPGGDQGGSTLKCAACGCHRNFHRKEVASPAAGAAGGGGGCVDHYFLHPSPPVGWDQKRVFERFPYLSALPMPPPAFMAAAPAHMYGGGGIFGAVESRDQDRRSETPDGREDHHRHQVVVGLLKNSSSNNSNNKRFRTKFTQEQKEKMMDFAEKLGWRIQRHDDMALNEFCSEIGVKRRTLKVWMHNNKSALRKRDDAAAAVAVAVVDATGHEDDAAAATATESPGGS